MTLRTPVRACRAGNSDTNLVVPPPAHDDARSAAPCHRSARRPLPAPRPQIPNWWRAHLRTAITDTKLVALHPPPFARDSARIPAPRGPDIRRETMVQTVQKNIRLSPEQWERIEKAADERGTLRQPAPRRARHRSARPPRMAPHRGRNPSPALRDVHRPGHGPRHGGGRTRRRDRRNRPQHLQDRPGVAARNGRKRVIVKPPRGNIGRRHGRFDRNPGAAANPDATTRTP